jgi:LPXTG-site transpeptidase (sortase) family protein
MLNPRSNKWPIILASLLCIILIATVVLGWLYYTRAQQPKPVVYDTNDPVARQAVEGREEVVVTPDALAGYQVAADMPRILSIDSIGVRARVVPMGVNPDNSLQAPVNIYDSGWYNASAQPGQPGAAVIDAHASGPTRQGLFAYLDTMQNGDRVKVERGDGQVFEYDVVAVETMALDAIDMQKVLKPYGDATEGLNLITCTGQWLQEQRTYNQRAIVYTKRV